jgi:hypothetical protein
LLKFYTAPHNCLAALHKTRHVSLTTRFRKTEFMSQNNNPTWNTKDGPRRVRNEAPTIEEAIVAAQGLTDEAGAQAEIAAALLGLPLEQVRAALANLRAPRKDTKRSIAFTGPASAPRTVVVERKPSRRSIAVPRNSRPVWSSARGVTIASPR